MLLIFWLTIISDQSQTKIHAMSAAVRPGPQGSAGVRGGLMDIYAVVCASISLVGFTYTFQMLPLPRKVTLEHHQTQRLPRKVKLQHHQMLRLPRKNGSHDWSCSHVKHHLHRAEQQHSPPTSPNTAPATQNATHDWFPSHIYETPFANAAPARKNDSHDWSYYHNMKCYFTELLLDWAVTWLSCYLTDPLLYWAVTWQGCYLTDLLLYWSVTLLSCYWAVLLYWSITLLGCYFT